MHPRGFRLQVKNLGDSMTDRVHGLLNTVTIRRSWPAATATGANALVLDTVEMGPIAFVVTLETIQILRGELAKIEAQLTRPQGNA